MSTKIGPRILPPHLREGLLLDILDALLQSNHFGGQGVDHLAMGLPVSLEVLNLNGLLLRPPNKIVDHIGQLVYLYVLEVNTLIRLVPLGARGGVLTQCITNTLQGNGQRT
jgi:hypothetical protein